MGLGRLINIGSSRLRTTGLLAKVAHLLNYCYRTKLTFHGQPKILDFRYLHLCNRNPLGNLEYFLTSLWNSECVCIYIKFNYIHNLLFDIYSIDNLIFNTYSMPSTKTLLSLMDPLGLSLFLLSQSHQFWNNLIRNGKIPLNRLASIRR